MKVVVHNPCAAGAFVRLPLMLSMMQERLDAGDEVVSIECDAAVPACVVTLDGDPAICRFCAVRAARGRGLLSRPIRVRQLSEFVPPHLATQVRSSRDSFASLAEFKALCHQGVDVGYAALSTYAHVTRDPEPDLSRRVVRDRLQRLVHTARLVHAAWQRVLAEERPDLVLMFNGRLDIDRPVLRACQAAGVPCHAYEVGMGVDAVTRFDNALPHDIGYLVRTIDALWQQAGPERAEVGAAFFQMRRAGTRSHTVAGAELRTNDQPFIGSQVQGLLPPTWDPQARNIVVFGSSDDEFCSIAPEWEESPYPGQLEALVAMATALADTPDIRLWLRMHPRLRGIDRPFVRRMAALGARHPNLTVIPPAAPVSSYALLDHARTVCTFRSTLTMEAQYWGKPVVALANSYFRQLGGSHAPATHAEVLALLRQDLPRPDPTPALKLGYYQMRGGFRSPYYQGERSQGARRGYRFKGDPIRVGGLAQLRYRFARWRQKWSLT